MQLFNKYIPACLLYMFITWAKPIPVMIFKTPRSGSTWFTSLFNKLSKVYITPEMFHFQHAEDSKQYIKEAPAYLVKSLQMPMKQYPGGEAKNLKGEYLVVGANFNPLWTSWVDLSGIMKAVPDVRIIMFTRTNVVKHVLSQLRRTSMMRKCGDIFNHGSCDPGKMKVRTYFFDRWLIKFMAYDQYMADKTRELVGKHNVRQFYHVRYEDLLANENKFLDILDWVGYDINHLEQKSSIKLCNNCSKSTSDDLHDVLENYDEVEAWIKKRYPCLLRQLYETDPGMVQFPIEYYCDDLFTKRVNECIEYLKINGSKLCW